jgi:hypothetical protein
VWYYQIYITYSILNKKCCTNLWVLHQRCYTFYTATGCCMMQRSFVQLTNNKSTASYIIITSTYDVCKWKHITSWISCKCTYDIFMFWTCEYSCIVDLHLYMIIDFPCIIYIVDVYHALCMYMYIHIFSYAWIYVYWEIESMKFSVKMIKYEVGKM